MTGKNVKIQPIRVGNDIVADMPQHHWIPRHLGTSPFHGQALSALSFVPSGDSGEPHTAIVCWVGNLVGVGDSFA